METIAIRMMIAVLGVAVSAHMRLTAVIAGRPYGVPVLLVVAAVMVLAAVLGVLCVARLLLRDGLRLRPVAS